MPIKHYKVKRVNEESLQDNVWVLNILILLSKIIQDSLSLKIF